MWYAMCDYTYLLLWPHWRLNGLLTVWRHSRLNIDYHYRSPPRLPAAAAAARPSPQCPAAAAATKRASGPAVKGKGTGTALHMSTAVSPGLPVTLVARRPLRLPALTPSHTPTHSRASGILDYRGLATVPVGPQIHRSPTGQHRQAAKNITPNKNKNKNNRSPRGMLVYFTSTPCMALLCIMPALGSAAH